MAPSVDPPFDSPVVQSREPPELLHMLALPALLATGMSLLVPPPVPLPAHSHNDYEQTRPLFDTLAHGFLSVEADIWFQNEKLLVAHTPLAWKPDRTLQSLYLDPLRERVKRNGGKVYP